MTTSLGVLMAALLAPRLSIAATLPAFPGADGAGMHVTGGRGGIVYHVTRLDESSADNTPGTLRYGLDDKNFPGKEPRTIVFDVGGRIFMGKAPQDGWDPNGNGWDTSSRLTIKSNITIAGETAPPPGIVIMGGTIKPGGDNIIIRHITVAPGYGNKSFFEPGKGPPKHDDRPDSFSYDAFDISGTNIIIDHCTTVDATDETISMNEMADNITIQYCIIAQGQNYPQGDAEASGVKFTGHALGSIFGATDNAKISAHHNLYAHLKGRLPRVGCEKGSGAYNDFRNNVFYNWLGTAGSGARGQPSFNNIINNFYLAGPGGDNATDGPSPAITKSPGGQQLFDGYDPAITRVYASGNIKDVDRNDDPGDLAETTASESERADFRRVSVAKSAFTQVPYAGKTELAVDARDNVLKDAGARPWDRSLMDKRIVDEVRLVRGKIVAWADDPFNDDPREGVEWRSLVNLKGTSRPADFDSDQDGMADAWETANKLDPRSADNNGDADADGYTNLEEYLHECAGGKTK